MPPHVVVIIAIAAFVMACWLLGEVLVLARECRRLQRSAPPRLPIGAPTIEERVQALETWRRESAERTAKEQEQGPSRESQRQQVISINRCQLLAARALVDSLRGCPEHTLIVAQAKAQIAATTEALRFHGVES